MMEEPIKNVSPQNLTFSSLMSRAPDDLVKHLETLKQVDQNRYWHPEGSVYIHTRCVVDRLARFGDINLSLAGIFHDEGKMRTTVWDDIKQTWRSPGHAQYSIEAIRAWSYWIYDEGASVNLVSDIVQWHMYIKDGKDLPRWKIESFKRSYIWPYIEKFMTCDIGGIII